MVKLEPDRIVEQEQERISTNQIPTIFCFSVQLSPSLQELCGQGIKGRSREGTEDDDEDGESGCLSRRTSVER